MKLYLFAFDGFFEEFTMKEFDVEEKNKTYVCKGRRFNKSDIGHASGLYMNECTLLENDPGKAASILLLQKEKEIENIQKQCERDCNEKRANIEMLKRYISKTVEHKIYVVKFSDGSYHWDYPGQICLVKNDAKKMTWEEAEDIKNKAIKAGFKGTVIEII